MEWNRLQKRPELKKWSRHNVSPMLRSTITYIETKYQGDNIGNRCATSNTAS